MAPFYLTLCSELDRPLNSDLLDKMKADNVKKLEKLQEDIENAEKNFGETEQRDALLAKAEYLSKIGDKVIIETLVEKNSSSLLYALFI